MDGQIRILVVEDSPKILEIIENYLLKPNGFLVDVATAKLRFTRHKLILAVVQLKHLAGLGLQIIQLLQQVTGFEGVALDLDGGKHFCALPPLLKDSHPTPTQIVKARSK